MCGFSKKNGKEGIKFKNGDFLTIEEIKLENLTPEQIRELEEMKIVNELAIRKRLHEYGNLLQRVLNKLSKIEEGLIKESDVNEIIDKRFQKHFNDEKMNKYLEEKWVEIFRDKILSFSVLIKAIFVIISSFLGLGLIIEIIKGKL